MWHCQNNGDYKRKKYLKQRETDFFLYKGPPIQDLKESDQLDVPERPIEDYLDYACSTYTKQQRKGQMRNTPILEC